MCMLKLINILKSLNVLYFGDDYSFIYYLQCGPCLFGRLDYYGATAKTLPNWMYLLGAFQMISFLSPSM